MGNVEGEEVQYAHASEPPEAGCNIQAPPEDQGLQTVPEIPEDVAEDWRQLYATIQGLLIDEAALKEQCEKLMPVVGSAYVASGAESGADMPEHEGQPTSLAEKRRILPAGLREVTQYIINRTGCRHPVTLKRASTVFAGFAFRKDGLSPGEFRGYVASILTQVLRELEYRSAAAGIHLEDPAELTRQPQLSPRDGLSGELSPRSRTGVCTPPLPPPNAVLSPAAAAHAIAAAAPVGSDLTSLDLPEGSAVGASALRPPAPVEGGGATTTIKGLSELETLTKELEALSTSLGGGMTSTPDAASVDIGCGPELPVGAAAALEPSRLPVVEVDVGGDSDSAPNMDLQALLSSLSSDPLLGSHQVFPEYDADAHPEEGSNCANEQEDNVGKPQAAEDA